MALIAIAIRNKATADEAVSQALADAVVWILIAASVVFDLVSVLVHVLNR